MTDYSSPVRLTVAILARDAEHVLSATLDTARQLTTDVVVLDTGSRDRTIQIATNGGARVLEAAWQDDFAAARNLLWDTLKGEWILWLDAGEEISPEDRAALRQFLDAEADSSKAYMLLVCVPPAPQAIAGEQIGAVRLVPNRRDLRFRGRLHENLNEWLERAGVGVEGLPYRIQRGMWEHAESRKVARAKRNLHIVQIQIQEQGQLPQHLVTLAGALADLGQHDSAISCYRKAIQNAPAGSRESREAYYGMLSALDAEPTQRQRQIDLCVEALGAFPLDAQLLCAMGGYLQANGQNELAARAYQTAFEFGSLDPSIWHVTDIHQIAAICRSLIAQLENDDLAARQALDQAIERYPDSARLRRHLIHVHIRAGRRKEALEESDRLTLDAADRNSLRTAIRGACLAARQSWVPSIGYLQTAYSEGCRDLICLRWLAVALLSSGDADSALPILHQWRALDPRSIEVQKYLDTVSPADLQEPAAANARQFRLDPPSHPVRADHLQVHNVAVSTASTGERP